MLNHCLTLLLYIRAECVDSCKVHYTFRSYTVSRSTLIPLAHKIRFFPFLIYVIQHFFIWSPPPAQIPLCRKMPSWNFWRVYGGSEPRRNRVIVPARQATEAGGIHSLESIPRLHKRLKNKNTGSGIKPRSLLRRWHWYRRSNHSARSHHKIAICPGRDYKFLPSPCVFYIFVKKHF
jgi:hypothetical protein